jgi:hypothetical protein
MPMKQQFGLTQQGSKNRDKILVPEAQNALEDMKWEIATAFGVRLGADSTSRENGSVGGEMVRRMIELAKQQLSGRVGRI